MTWTTADICDEFEDETRVLQLALTAYGSMNSFCGQVVTVKCFEDSSLVKVQKEFFLLPALTGVDAV